MFDDLPVDPLVDSPPIAASFSTIPLPLCPARYSRAASRTVSARSGTSSKPVSVSRTHCGSLPLRSLPRHVPACQFLHCLTMAAETRLLLVSDSSCARIITSSE